MKKIYLILFLISTLAFQTLSAQTIFTQWNFDGSSTAPNFGTGSMSLIGGTLESGTAYPTGNPASGKAYSITNFPSDTNASGTAGYRFDVTTTGYTDITVSFDVSGTNQSSKWQQYEYTTNGTTWTVIGNNTPSGLITNFLTKTYVLPASCSNNPNFGFRIVSIFTPPSGTAYASVQGGGYNGSNGRWNIDNVNFSFNPLKRNSLDKNYFTMYPNPVRGNELTITSVSNGETSIVIFNVLGKKVFETKVVNNKINLSGLNTGIYMIKITEGDKTSTKKLVIE